MSENNVFCIGVWDMFHAGHLSLLKQAASLGNLTVGVVMDEAVKRQKGANRPVICQENRIAIVSELRCVWYTMFVDDFEIPEVILKNWNIIVLGEDQSHIKNAKLISTDKLYVIKRPKDGNCTSEIIKKIKEK